MARNDNNFPGVASLVNFCSLILDSQWFFCVPRSDLLTPSLSFHLGKDRTASLYMGTIIFSSPFPNDSFFSTFHT